MLRGANPRLPQIKNERTNKAMIEFRTNYTPGPWKSHERVEPVGYAKFEIHFSADGECVSEVVHAKEDALLISMAPQMAEYMMKKARKISSDLKCDMFLLSPYDTRISALNNELDEILPILKDAGIEVVEK